MYADYVFYTTVYMGNVIPEDDFPRLMTRAGEYLDSMIQGPRPDTEAAKKAACAVAEAWQVGEQGGEVVSQTVGSWSRSYAAVKGKSRDGRLLDAAMPYIPELLRPVRWA